MAGKNYWLKLGKKYFERHDIRILESQSREYAYFYLKLLVESIDHEGRLRFNDFIPYDEEMLSVITNTPVDTVRVAIEVLKNMNLIEMMDDGTIFMNMVEKMVGSETEWAKKKRAYRLNQGEVKQVETNDDWFLKSQEIWEKTFAEYPKKYAEDKARFEWETMVTSVRDMDARLELTRDIYRAIRLYVADYKENSPDDTSYKYVPRMDRWLIDHLPVWMKKVGEKK